MDLIVLDYKVNTTAMIHEQVFGIVMGEPVTYTAKAKDMGH